MGDPIDVDRLRPLLEVPPPEFVAARNALVKELKAAKQRDQAALVGAIRRPSWTDWALNRVAVDDPDLVTELTDAAAQLREAQAASIEGRDGPDLRSSMASLRGAIAAVSRAAGGALRDAERPADAAELGARLGDVAANADAVAQLRAGVLGASTPGDDDLFAGLTPAPRPSGATSRPSTEPPPPTPRPALAVVEGGRGSSADEGGDRQAQRAAARDRARARAPLAKALDAAVRKRSVASEKLDAARRELAEAEDAVSAAEQTVTDAEDALARFDASGDG